MKNKKAKKSKVNFEDILDADEKIVKVSFPNKVRYLVINVVFDLLGLVFMGFGLIIGGIIGGIINNVDSVKIMASLISTGSALSIIFISAIIYICVKFYQTSYCVTNKRVIIKTGFIGVDFSALDLESIGAINVNVNLLDKLVRPSYTGSIEFGSMSMPISTINVKGGAKRLYTFKHVDKPYELYQEIKQLISERKEDLNPLREKIREMKK